MRKAAAIEQRASEFPRKITSTRPQATTSSLVPTKAEDTRSHKSVRARARATRPAQRQRGRLTPGLLLPAALPTHLRSPVLSLKRPNCRDRFHSISRSPSTPHRDSNSWPRMLRARFAAGFAGTWLPAPAAPCSCTYLVDSPRLVKNCSNLETGARGKRPLP